MYIGVDIGGTKTLIATFSEEGELLESNKFPTPPEYGQFITELQKRLDTIRHGNTPRAIAVAVPGTIDYKTDVVRHCGNLAWENIPLKQDLAKVYDCPIEVDNDANIGALNEARKGAGAKFSEVLYITISTGIGTGVTVNGRIDPALANSEGGQMHFRHEGKMMRWEHFASGKAFFNRFGKMGAEVSDPKIWDEWSADVSLGVGSLLAVIHPEVVVIGGSMGEHLHKYKQALLDHLEDVRSPMIEIPPILPAVDPDNAVINGCYLLARDTVV